MPWKELNKMEERLSFVLKSLSSETNFSELCSEYGISRKVGYKWKKRFMERGKPGLFDLSKRPQNSPNQLSEDVICKIIKLKNGPIKKHWGARKLRQIYLNEHGDAPSESSFKRILEKAGFVKKRRKRKSYPKERIEEKIIPVKPNELWTVDFKGWWMTSDNKKCEPLTIRDDFSKYILLAMPLGNSKTETVKNAFKKVFRKYGIPDYIKSDNGSPFACTRSPQGLSALSSWWVSLGIGLDRIRPGHPEENGSHERMHRDLKFEIQKPLHGGLRTFEHALEVWRKSYNDERPHETLGLKIPNEIYKKSERKYIETSVIEYPVNYMRRKVMSNGQVCLNGAKINLTASIRGHYVGIKPVDEGIMEVWFDYLNLGIIDIEKEIFISASQH